MIDRPLLKFHDEDKTEFAETPIEFDERTDRKLHVYPTDCEDCGATLGAVITKGYEGEGESWCLRCGKDDREPDGKHVHPMFHREAHAPWR